jgi:plastocyanin
MNSRSNRSTAAADLPEGVMPAEAIATPHRLRNQVLVLTSVLALLAIAACGKSSSPTSPYGGGGGGGGGGGAGGGTTFNFGPFAQGQSASFTFPTAGTFGYHCIPHQAMGMVGTVQVDGNAGALDSALVSIGAGGGLTFSPTPAHIKPGGHVRWVNVSTSNIHTVTSNT